MLNDCAEKFVHVAAGTVMENILVNSTSANSPNPFWADHAVSRGKREGAKEGLMKADKERERKEREREKV